MSRSWTTPLPLHELARGPLSVRLEPDAAERAKIAHDLGLESLPALGAELTIRAWLDGAVIAGGFHAVVEQVCSVSLEPFQQPLAGDIAVRLLPRTSPNVPSEGGGELDYDPNAPDPPDLIEGEAIDLAAYVVEHLALELDPFPRKPGAQFEFQPSMDEDSPFAALKRLKDEKE